MTSLRELFTYVRPRRGCLLCGASSLAGFAQVTNAQGRRVGSVCSAHTLWEVVKSERFDLIITQVEHEVRCELCARLITDPNDAALGNCSCCGTGNGLLYKACMHRMAHPQHG